MFTLIWNCPQTTQPASETYSPERWPAEGDRDVDEKMIPVFYSLFWEA